MTANKTRVQVKGTIGKSVRLPDNTASGGATIGVNLKLPDGTIPTLAALAAALMTQDALTDQPGNIINPTGGVPIIWQEIQYVPPNIIYPGRAILDEDQGEEYGRMAIPGPIGPRGLQGLPGLAADDPEDNLIVPGLQGATGAAGAQGATLYPDDPDDPLIVPGPPGAAGSPGAAGATGITIPMYAEDADDPLIVPGATGPQGLPGAAGAPGFTIVLPVEDPDDVLHIPGQQGVQGPQGVTGGVGPSGISVPLQPDDPDDVMVIPGSQGKQGNTGLTGPIGATMPYYPEDPDDVMPIPGQQGTQGVQGAQGLVGQPGVTIPLYAEDADDVPVIPGQQGVQGVQGQQGIPGIVIPMWAEDADDVLHIPGSQGITGPQGAQGLAGQPGVTIPLYVEDADDVMPIPGQQGVQGVQGIQGAAGLIIDRYPEDPDDPIGQPGAAGPAGAQGLQGLTGQPGITIPLYAEDADDVPVVPGAQGVQGVAGTAGANGITIPMYAEDADDITPIPGQQGITGATGAQGLTGQPGVTIPLYAEDADDVPVIPGAQGPQGLQGPAGTSASSAGGWAAQFIEEDNGEAWTNGSQALPTSPWFNTVNVVGPQAYLTLATSPNGAPLFQASVSATQARLYTYNPTGAAFSQIIAGSSSEANYQAQANGVVIAMASNAGAATDAYGIPSGAVGIGSSSATADLWLATNATPRLQVDGATGQVSINAPTTGSTITANQVVGGYGLQVVGATGGSAQIAIQDGNTGTRSWQIRVGQIAAGEFDFYDNVATKSRVQLPTTGGVTITQADSGFALDVTGATSAGVAVFRGTTGAGLIGVVDGQTGARFWQFGTGITAAGTFDIRDNSASGTPVRVSISTSGNFIVPSTAGHIASQGLNSSTAYTVTGAYLNGYNGGEILQVNGSAGTNLKIWDSYVDTAGTLHMRLVNDANNAATDWMTLVRSTYVGASISFPSGPVTVGGAFAINNGTATTKPTGYGSPSGTVTASITGSSSLPQVAGTLAAFLAYMKTIGFIGA